MSPCDCRLLPTLNRNRILGVQHLCHPSHPIPVHLLVRMLGSDEETYPHYGDGRHAVSKFFPCNLYLQGDSE